MQINIYEAKAKLSHLVAMAMNGEEVIISKSGLPMVKLTPLEKKQVKFGFWKSKVKIADDFDKLPEDIAKYFSGEAE